MIYAAADLHGELPEVPSDATMLLLAGDICPDYRRDFCAERQANWLDTEFRAWLEPLVAGGVKTVATWGNHDFVGEKPFLWRGMLPWTVLADELLITETGLTIYGSPWVPGLPRWAFYASGPALRARAELIPSGLDVLMAHGPPYLYGDYIPTSEKQRNKYGNFGGENVGDKYLSSAISRVAPGITVCGHIHDARGRYTTATGQRVENVAAVDATYNLVSDPWVKIEL